MTVGKVCHLALGGPVIMPHRVVSLTGIHDLYPLNPLIIIILRLTDAIRISVKGSFCAEIVATFCIDVAAY